MYFRFGGNDSSDGMMKMEPDFNVATAHRYFASHCFNGAWGLLDKPDRTTEEDQQMVALSYASLYHWSNRSDCDNQTLSIGYWQLSRIHAILGNATEAVRHAQICFSYSKELSPFYLGYAHEALARAHRLAGKNAIATEHLNTAHELAVLIEDNSEREALLADLQSLTESA